MLILVATYQFGQNMGNAELQNLRGEMGELRGARTDLEKQVVTLRADAMTNENKLHELEQQYNDDIGDMNLRALNRLLRERLASGVTTERLQEVIAAASNVRNCSAPETKRFIVQTPAAKGPPSKVSFGSGLITIMASGDAAVNAKGGKESWFDSAKPVQLSINVRGGENVSKEEVLPFHYSIIQGATEYRITITPTSRSYAEVTADQCAYP